MFHLEHFVKLPKTDQADHSQHAQQYKISRRQRRKCDDDQKWIPLINLVLNILLLLDSTETSVSAIILLDRLD